MRRRLFQLILRLGLCLLPLWGGLPIALYRADGTSSCSARGCCCGHERSCCDSQSGSAFLQPGCGCGQPGSSSTLFSATWIALPFEGAMTFERLARIDQRLPRPSQPAVGWCCIPDPPPPRAGTLAVQA